MEQPKEKFTCDWCHKEYTMGQFGKQVGWKELPEKRTNLCIFCEEDFDDVANYEPGDHEAEESEGDSDE